MQLNLRCQSALKGNLEHSIRRFGCKTVRAWGATAGMAMTGAQAQSEEARYRLLVESITDYAIYMLDPEGIVTSWNAGAERIKGYKSAEIIGRPFSVFYTLEDRAAGKADHALRTAASEGRFEAEGWRLRKDGTRFWTHVIIDPIRDPSGTIIGYAKITRDLTERKLAEAALKSSEQQFRLLVQGVTDYAIYMLDSDGKVASWNSGAQRIKGYTPEEIIGEHFGRFYPEDDRDAGEPQRSLRIARQAGRFETEAWRVRKDGTRFRAHFWGTELVATVFLFIFFIFLAFLL